MIGLGSLVRFEYYIFDFSAKTWLENSMFLGWIGFHLKSEELQTNRYCGHFGKRFDHYK